MVNNMLPVFEQKFMLCDLHSLKIVFFETGVILPFVVAFYLNSSRFCFSCLVPEEKCREACENLVHGNCIVSSFALN